MSLQAKGVGILGLGSCLPEKVLTNADLEKMVDTTDEWIIKRTGISERRVLDKETPAYELGIEASKRAIADSGITAEDIDLIIVTTETPDYLTPSTACIIQGTIGAKKAAAFDMNAACSGMMYGMDVAKQFIKGGVYKYVLVVGCEGLSKATDWEDRATCILFGDGAGAVVLGEVDPEYGILATELGADGTMSHNITLPAFHCSEKDIEKRLHGQKQVIWMDGGEVFKFAVRIMDSATRSVLDKAGISLDDVKIIFPHQANIRIIDGAAKRLDVSGDRIYKSIHKYGNISSASIPVSLDDAYQKGLLQKGDYIVMVGFGGGLTWGSTLVRWSKD